jgi:hypothetical protein
VSWRRRSALRIDLDYPIVPKARYGYGKPVDAALRSRIERNREFYRRSLREFLAFADDFVRIPKIPADLVAPCSHNGFLSGLDAVALYSFMALRKPRNYFEIGSGYSTQFARRAIQDHRLQTAITLRGRRSIPSAIDACELRWNKLPLELFDELTFWRMASGSASRCRTRLSVRRRS